MVLVDPPRAGLDADTLNSVLKFDNILYISCNPKSLHRNLREGLAATHKIERIAVFDQFACTPFLEVAVLLRRKSSHN